MTNIKDFQSSYATKAISFWTTRPYAMHAREQFTKRPYGLEAQFIYESSESLKDCCFDLTERLHDYDNDVEVRTGQDKTHRILFLCTSPEEALMLAKSLNQNPDIRVHKLF